MTIEVKKYIEGDEIFESFHVKNESGDDQYVVPFYVNEEIIKAEKSLKYGIEFLPELIQKVYDAGKNGEELNLSVEDIQV